MNEYYVLSNGVKIPKIGFGTWQIPDGEVAKNAVRTAIEVGYRHIDTAAIYGNEVGVGQGIKESGVPRNEIFLTTKVWNTDQGYESTKKAFQTSLDKLQTDYVDLYLIHWPAVNIFDNYVEKNLETWRAMEDIYRSGKARAIGICNFFEHHLEPLLEKAVIKPMVNQIEINPGNPADDVVSFCESKGILVQAYSPMMKGKIFDIPLLQELAQKYQRTISQIVLRWVIERGINPLSKSVTVERIRDNFDIFNFSIEPSDMEQIKTLSNLGRVGTHPDKARF
ncbi:MAG TPA: aldo/keto reductase [Bacilli bacterium]|nr:aldo/keto reductase [Bacilli bacterium]